MSKFKKGAKELFGIAKSLAKGEDLSVPDEIKNKRRRVCESCPHLNKTKRCDLCGCFYLAKTMVSTSECPEKRWLKWEKNNES